MPLPDVATDVRPSEKAIEQLRQCAQVMMVAVPEKEMEVLREGLVCFFLLFLILPLAYVMLIVLLCIVFPSGNIERSTDRRADTRRETGGPQDERRGQGRRFYRCGTWCLGYFACSWYGIGAFGADAWTAD